MPSPTSPALLSAPSLPCPRLRPSALTTALLTPVLRDNGSLSKKSRKKRGAGYHRIACLLTESLKAAPHKSKSSIIGIVFPRATCPTKVPLLCSLFCLYASFTSCRESAKSEVEILNLGGLFLQIWHFLGVSSLLSFSLAVQPSSCFVLLNSQTFLDWFFEGMILLSLNQHNLSLCTL